MELKIKKGKLKLPRHLSVEAKDLIISLLNQNAEKRLGAGKEDAKAIKKHPWFKNIDWNSAMKRELNVPKPEIKPIIKGLVDPERFETLGRGYDIVKGWEYVNRNAK